MSSSQTRFVTACQQLLALGVVLAALTPAATVVTLDVVHDVPGTSSAAAPAVSLSAYVRAASRPSAVPTAPVTPTVREVALTPSAGDARALGRGPASAAITRLSDGGRRLVSPAESAAGTGAVGLTWAAGETLAEDAASFRVRTRTDGTWSGWTALPYHDDHGPDPDSREGRHARPGTDPVWVGDVDEVQVEATTQGAPLPDDLALALVDPGTPQATTEQTAAIDTSTMDGDDGSDSVTRAAALLADGADGSGLALAAATFTPKPVIYSRAQWGADESMRDPSSLHYYEVHAGFVHHTVNANDYTRTQVPAIIRSIYAYHTQSKGWSDIGYNFVVDRFGRIWEGRYGGVDRPVVGAHTLGYNDYSFAMSAIGNYETAKPTAATLQAYGALFGWKLSLHGVDASSTSQQVGPDTFQAINGHRDAGQTACPGRYLYAKVPRIRELAAEAQQGWSGRDLESNLAGADYPDLVVRRASDGAILTLPTGGLIGVRPPIAVGGDVSGTRVQAAADLTDDGRADLLLTAGDGSVTVRPGLGDGAFGPATDPATALAGSRGVRPVGDVDGDGHGDLIGRDADGAWTLWSGHGNGRFRGSALGASWDGVRAVAPAGDLDGDGHADVLVSPKAGVWAWRRATGTGGFKDAVALAGDWSGYDLVTGFGDVDRDGHADLLVRVAGGNAWVLPGDGDGTFGRPHGPIARLASRPRLSAADLDDDGSADALSQRRGALRLLRGNGRVDLARLVDSGLRAPGITALLNAGDWDRDGHADIVMRSAGGALVLRRGDGTGHFGKAVRLGTGFDRVRLLAAVGDMTGDGYPDLMGQPARGSMRLYPGRGLDGLGASYVAHSAIDSGDQVAVGRWDADGSPDSLFRIDGHLFLYPGNGPGGLTGRTALGVDVSAYDWLVGISAATLSGGPDVVARDKRTGNLWLLQRTGTSVTRRFLGEGMGVYDLAG